MDYDNFYRLVVLKASNATKADWLASYEPVVGFIAKVRQDVDALADANKRALAKAVHDNGYWRGQQQRVRDASDPFLGARFKANDDALKTVLTPKGYERPTGTGTRQGRGDTASLSMPWPIERPSTNSRART
jgi:hypothetical protein